MFEKAVVLKVYQPFFSVGPKGPRSRASGWPLLAAVCLLLSACYGDEYDDTDRDPPPTDRVLTRVQVLPSSATKAIGDTQPFTATAHYSDSTSHTLASDAPQWVSSNAAIASVSPTGLATALANGNTQIRATYEGLTGEATLTVSAVAAPSVFKVGIGQANHDPVSRVCIGGGSTNCGRAAGPDAIRDPLIARAMAITGANGQTFMVITTTNIGYFLAYKPEQSGLNGIYDVRLRIAQATGVPSTHIIVVSDHSHNGPDTIGIWGGVSAAYMKITADSVVKAATQAFASRRDAILRVASVNQNGSRVAGVPLLDSSYDLAPGNELALGNPYNEFRMLVADDATSGARILTFVNYAPHATVTNGDRFDGQYRLTGDWAAWLPDEANKLYGGMGLAALGALGATDWNKTGNIEEKEAEARLRLRNLMQAATLRLVPVQGADVGVESTFIREPLAQPFLLLNYKPGIDRNDPAVPSDGFDVRIDRSVLPPFLTGAVVGTYVSAVRIGDVFLSTFPGEPFGELDHALQNEGRIVGAREHFLLGGANDFFGYMVKNQATYEQTLRTGAFYLGGCPEAELAGQIGLREEGEGACADHWTLMVSPTIGSHIVCTLQDSADRLGFTTANRDDECPVLTALDGMAAPPESDSPLIGPLFDARQSAVAQARDLAAQCAGTGAPAPLCMALADGARQAEIYLGAEPVPSGPETPAPASNEGLPNTDSRLQTPLMTAEQASCAPDNSGPFTDYIGSLHEHSGYSDGTAGKIPADYFAAGKAQGRDFVGSSEHSDNALIPLTVSDGCASAEFPTCITPLPAAENPAAPVSKWALTLQQARAATNASFTAFRGFEWTSDRFGHINVFFSRNDFNAKSTDGYTASMEGFYNWFKTLPAAGGGADGLLVFNHPGREDMLHAGSPVGDPAYAFNGFQYRADADLRAVGVEVFGKSGDAYDTDNSAPPGGWYAFALDRGWHLGPVGAEDEHGVEWAKPTRAKTVLIARDRSEGALREAMLARRFYALSQGHNDIRLSFTAAGQPMGSRLARTLGALVLLEGTVTSGAAIHHVDLVTRGGAVLATRLGNTISAAVTVAAGERWYYLRAVRADGRPVAYSAPIWIRGGGAYPTCGEWLAGDLHVHTTYSHDSYGGPADDNTGPEEFYTLGHSVENQFRIGALRGLDYLAITDHNNVRSQSDPGFGAFGLIGLPSYENSLSGHAQMHGARRVYEGGSSAAGVNTQAAALRADGGVFQINHPADKNAAPYAPDNLGWSYGFGVQPDVIEVWNIGVRAYQAPLPSYTNNDASTQFWEDWLNRGHKVGATGGSDNHWVTLTAAAGAGQPTTWVFARERSARGVLEGLKAGRTFISHQPPLMAGPRVLIEADRDGDGIFESIIGDTVPRAAALRARVSGAPGALVRIYSGGADFIETAMPLLALETTVPISLPAARTWLRAEVLLPDAAEARAMLSPVCDALGQLGENGFPEDTGTTYCRNRLAVLAMTSAIYLQ